MITEQINIELRSLLEKAVYSDKLDSEQKNRLNAKINNLIAELGDMNKKCVSPCTIKETFILRKMCGLGTCEEITENELIKAMNNIIYEMKYFLPSGENHYFLSAFDFKEVNRDYKGKPIGELELSDALHHKLIKLSIFSVDDLLNQDFGRICEKLYPPSLMTELKDKIKLSGLKTIDEFKEDEIHYILNQKLIDNELLSGYDYIECLPIDAHEYNLLKNFGIDKISELTSLTRDTISKIYLNQLLNPNIGLNIIRKIHKFNLKFRDEMTVVSTEKFIDVLNISCREYRYLLDNFDNMFTIEDLSHLSEEELKKNAHSQSELCDVIDINEKLNEYLNHHTKQKVK